MRVLKKRVSCACVCGVLMKYVKEVLPAAVTCFNSVAFITIVYQREMS